MKSFPNLPFSTAFEFAAFRSFTLNGVNYERGQTIDKSAVGEGLLRKLFMQKRIIPLIEGGEEIAARIAAPNASPPAQGSSEPAPVNPPTDQPPPATDTPSEPVSGLAGAPAAAGEGEAGNAPAAVVEPVSGLVAAPAGDDQSGKEGEGEGEADTPDDPNKPVVWETDKRGMRKWCVVRNGKEVARGFNTEALAEAHKQKMIADEAAAKAAG
jgi:hypothetical protein